MNGAENIKTLPASEVYKRIKKGLPVENAFIEEKIQLNSIASEKRIKSGEMKGYTETVIEQSVVFRNCDLKLLIAGECAYRRPIVLEQCRIENAAFDTCYAKAGMRMADCTFSNDIFLFLWSGHNKQPIEILNCTFRGYVDMFDAWFQGPVTIKHCRFLKGTNLLGNQGQPYRVSFDVAPVIVDNEGVLNLDGEIQDWKSAPFTMWMSLPGCSP